MRSLGDKRLRDLVQRFTDALEAGRVEVIVAMLTEDARFAMPPYPGWYRGRGVVAKSWLMPSGPPTGLRYLPAQANAQLALGAYKLDPQQGSWLPAALDVLSLRGARIAAITAFRTPQVFRASASRTGFPLAPSADHQALAYAYRGRQLPPDCHIDADPCPGHHGVSVMLTAQDRLGVWVNLNVNEPETLKAHNQAFCTRPPPPCLTSS
jgi:hypothetical protein